MTARPSPPPQSPSPSPSRTPPATSAGAGHPPVGPRVKLKPRPALFYGLLAVFFLWMLVLLAMWATLDS